MQIALNLKNQTFSKSERLCSTKVISALFENGYVFHTQLFKIVWTDSPVKLPFPARVAFSVSKRSFRLAVTRNLVKRRMREAYRKNKSVLYDHLQAFNHQIVFIVIMKGNTVPDYATVEKSMNDILRKLISFTVKTV